MTLKFNTLSPVTSNPLNSWVGLCLGMGRLLVRAPPSTESRPLAPEPPQMVSRPSAAPLPPALWCPLWPLHSWHSRLVPCPQEAFWCLVQICELYLPGYYGPHMVRGWDGIRGHGGGAGD